MKKFNVSDKCNTCGMCTTMTELLKEDAKGKVYAVESGYILEEAINEAKNVIDICPVHAITIVEAGTVNSIGKKGLKELEEVLKTKLQGIKKVKVTKRDIKFDSKQYNIDYADARGQNEYKYSSDSRATRAAIEEFDRIAYSQYRPFILSVFVQYKNDKLKPYYTFDEHSFYAKNNIQYERILKEIAAEAQSLSNGDIALPQDFTEFDVYPGGTDSSYRKDIVYGLQHFDEQSTQSGVMAEFKTGSYSSLDSYKMYIDTDDMEVYEGEDWRGRSKYKTKYCYRSVYSAVREYISDLKSAMNYVGIDENALYFVQEAIESYNKEISKEIERKIKVYKESIARL